MISIPPANGGGTITNSFPVSLSETDNTVKFFQASSAVRKSQATKRNKFVGLYNFTQSNAGAPLRLVHSLLPMPYLNQDEEHLAATLSNTVALPSIYTCPAAAASGSTIRLVTEKLAEKLSENVFPSGKVFTSTTRKVKTIKKFLQTGTKYKLIVIPNSFPIHPGGDEVVKGRVDDAMMGLFSTLAPFAGQWLGIMSDSIEGVTAFDEAFLATVLQNKAELSEHLPVYPSSLTICSRPTVNYTVNAMDRDDEDDFEERQAAVDEVLAAIAECNLRNAPSSVQRPPGLIDIQGENESAMGPNQPTSSMTTSTAGLQNDRMMAKLRLLCATFKEDRTVVLPDLNESIIATIAGPSTAQAESMGNNLRSTGDTLAESMDAVSRATRFPEAHFVTRTILVILLKGMLSTTPITNLEQVASTSSTSFNTAHLIPHGMDTADELTSIKSCIEQRDLQMHMQEDAAKLSAVNTKTICTPFLKDKYAVFGTCANTTCLLKTLVDFEAESIDRNEVPLLHHAARKMAIVISSKEYDTFQQNMLVASGDPAAKLNYLAFSTIDRALITLAKVLQDETAIASANPKNSNAKEDSISTVHFAATLGVIDRGIEMLLRVCSETEACESTAIYINSKFNPDRRGNNNNNKGKRSPASSPLRHEQPPSRRAKTTPGTTEKNVGAIICTNQLIPDINESDWPPGETKLCLGKLRDGSRGCPFKDNPGRCRNSHGAPHTWSTAVLTVMKKHVKTHDCLSWNMNVVTPALLGMRFQNSAAERAAAMADHRPNMPNVG